VPIPASSNSHQTPAREGDAAKEAILEWTDLTGVEPAAPESKPEAKAELAEGEKK
jgi:hypothetical protein